MLRAHFQIWAVFTVTVGLDLFRAKEVDRYASSREVGTPLPPEAVDRFSDLRLWAAESSLDELAIGRVEAV